ncbi:hypothetical protein FACS1894153_3230 [Bacteroidia bacterium]|nr:hypothetical protein FACS1894153_3230 [Bacteroidia bacterium]
MKKNLFISIAVIFTISINNVSFAQKYGNTEDDSVKCLTNTSLYQEFYKQRNFGDSYEPWLEVYKTCPASHKNVFIRGNVIVKYKITEASKAASVTAKSYQVANKKYIDAVNAYNTAAKNKATEESLAKLKSEIDATEVEKNDAYNAVDSAASVVDFYIDQLLNMWDVRAKYFGDEGYCYSHKAMDMQKYRKKNTKEIFELYGKAMQVGFGKEYTTPFFYFESAMDAEKDSILTKEDVLEAYDKASASLENLYNQNPQDTSIPKSINQLDIALLPYASCDEILPIYEKKYEGNKNDTNFLQKVCNLLDKKECTESDLFFKATEQLHSLSPTPKTAYLMAKMCDSKQMYDKVIEYLTSDAINSMPNDQIKVRCWLLLAKSFSAVNKYTESRNAAYEVVKLDPNNGMPYIIVGNMYAMSAKACGTEPQVSQRAAYWVAVDEFRKAKNADPSLAETADKLISTYSAHFPSGDDLFMMNFSEGASYTIGCWIQKSTTIRKK